MLSPEDHLLLIIMRLLLGGDLKDLANQFEIGERTASTVFHKASVLLARELKFLIA